MPSITQGYLDSSLARVRDFDKHRRQAASLDGRTMPSVEQLAIGDSRSFQIFAMFADLRHSTKAIGSLPLDQSARLLVNFLTEATKVIRDFGGQVEKYSGDRVLGMFGTEGGDPGELARQTIHCALTIRCVTRKVLNMFYKEKSLPSVRVAIGIDWGDVLIEKIGIRGTNELSVIGMAVNIASKLEDMAIDDQILLGNDVFVRLTSEYRELCKLQPPVQGWTFTQDGKQYSYFSFVGDFDICREV